MRSQPTNQLDHFKGSWLYRVLSSKMWLILLGNAISSLVEYLKIGLLCWGRFC